jgi:hypothetical protein
LQAILYLETNFVVGFATGRSREADALLTGPIGPIQLTIPGVCFMEAFSVLNNEEKSVNNFKRSINVEIHEAKRNIVYPHFPSALVKQLETALGARERTFNLYEGLLFAAIDGLCRTGEVIESPWTVVYKSLHTILMEDPTDNLILTTILHHANSHPSTVKAFLSENSKDFEKVDVKNALQLAGVKYFRDATNCMGWLNAQIGP